MKHPNILLLHTDEQRFNTIAALGAEHVVTPNLDRLTRRGVSFTRAYSSSPFCMPARHDLLTGVSARYHGYYQNNEHQSIADYGLATLPRMLTQQGYQTIAVGKMHFAPACEHHGFNHLFLMEEIPSCREDDAYLQFLEQHGYGDVRCQHGVRPMLYPTPQISRVPEEFHGAAWVAHKTNDLLRIQRTQPFFIWASWIGPHAPYYVPQKYLDMYKGREFPPSCLTPAQQRETDIVPELDVNHEWVRRLKEGYFASITLIDAWLGTILDTLDETGQTENTLILFTSDHGEMLGDRRWYSKTIPYEGSTHIPLILSGQGLPAGTQATVTVNTWDISATILDAAGITPPPNHRLIGSSLLKLNPSDPERIVISHQFSGHRRWISAVSDNKKYIHYYNGQPDEFYDLDTDPGEQHNLFDMDLHRDMQARLRQACITFELEHGDASAIADNEFIHFPSPVNTEFRWWPFNWMQFPRWMSGDSEADHAAILQEMRDVLATHGTVYIPTRADWRALVLDSWRQIGGTPEALMALFDEIDMRNNTDDCSPI